MTFLEVLDRMRNHTFFESESSAIEVIQTGLNVADDFWDNFILVCNNKDGLGSLLDVPPEKVATWGSKVQTMLDKAKNLGTGEEPKTKLIDTGNEEDSSDS